MEKPIKAVNGQKRCPVCATVKDVADFHNSKRLPDGLSNACKPCGNDQKRQWRAKNPDRQRAYNRAYNATNPNADRDRLTRFGLTACELTRMRINQSDLCAICGQCDRDRRLAIDHCHDTGRVRGLLCRACNVGIGHMKEDVSRLRSAIDYLSA